MDRRTYEELNPDEQAQAFKEVPLKERVELLLSSQDPGKLTRLMSPEEFYLMTKELSPEERGEIVCYTTLPQLVFLSDIDVWDGDQIHAKGFVTWLETLLEADETHFLAWLGQIDYEVIVAGFQKVVQVIKPDWEYPSDELLKDKPFFTLDQFYYIYVREEDFQTVRRVFQIIYEKRRGQYSAILEGILSELQGEVEEQAYQVRQVRLSERGFPDIETARVLYRPISQKEFDAYPLKRDTQPAASFKDEAPRPDYPLLWKQDHLFLDDVLMALRSNVAVHDGIYEEFVWLANKLIACDGIRFTSEDEVKKGIERARYFVNIGLEVLSDGDITKARHALERHWIEPILRWGLKEIYRVREEARTVLASYWKAMREPCLHFVATPYAEIFRGMYQQIPQRYDADLKDHLDGWRDFRSVAEVHATEQQVHAVRLAHRLLERFFPKMFRGLHMHQLHAKDENLTLTSFLSALYIHVALSQKMSDKPLTTKQLKSFIREGFEMRGDAKYLKAAQQEYFLSSLSEEERFATNEIWDRVFTNIEMSLGLLDPQAEIDTRFLQTIYIKHK